MKLKVLSLILFTSVVLTACSNSFNEDTKTIDEQLQITNKETNITTSEIETTISDYFESQEVIVSTFPTQETVTNISETIIENNMEETQTGTTTEETNEDLEQTFSEITTITDPVVTEVNNLETETTAITEELNIETTTNPELFGDFKDLYIQRPECTVSDEKTVYLTFDDGPNPKVTPNILDILKEKNIKATFFVVGQNIPGNEDILKRIIDEGHLLGVHTYCHQYQTIYSSETAYKEDFQRCFDLIFEATNYRPWAFRFPGGSINNHNRNIWSNIASEMNQRGFEYFDWTASLEDASTQANSQYCMNEFYNSCTSKYEIVLMHDSKKISLQCLPDIINYCEQNGYAFDTLTNANYHFNPKNFS